MAETDTMPEIFSDANFKRLARKTTKVDEFTRLVSEHVAGYSQKKKLVTGLKEMLTRVETAENKLYLARNLGKAKSKLETEEQALADNHTSADLKEKVQLLNTDMQTMLDEGRLTQDEKPIVHEQLLARRTAAKADGKEKLLEKLEKNISSVAKAKLIELPVPNLEAVYPAHLQLLDIERLEKKPQKNLAAHERTLLDKKAKVELSIKTWSAENRMWFENEFEFKPRLQRALDVLMKQKAADRIREEEEAVERKRKAEEEALEQKRLAQQQAEERKAQELEEKLKAKRLEAAAKPQKEAPQAKKKEKVKRVVLDNRDLFQPPPRNESDEEAEEDQTDSNEKAEAPNVEPPTAEKKKEPADSNAKPTAKVVEEAPKQPEKPAKAREAPKPKEEKESIWKSASPEPTNSEKENEDGSAAEPSLAEAAKSQPKAAAKAKIPPPAKKEKKKFTKLSANQLGFDCDNPNYVN
eukprot:TRINITY_DN13181_c0_g1_i1.p1 TRINITY_DN13181_c0_g1~~TRINITY_DN13181_c0_g1_i1.p1  ORF type:complete len:467 (+),score=137.77 TRINITY_DN13181_c0_g1_i1:99-1499(+)